MNVLVVDVGGTNVKILASGASEARKFPSGTGLTAAQMVEGVQKLAADWKYDVVAIGYPGPVIRDRPMAEPRNLAPGWVEFDFETAFGLPVRIINDAAMQALGSYTGGKLLFLGLGTGLGTTLVIDGVVEAMELAHLPYRKATYEHYVGLRGLERLGKKKWRKHIADVVARLAAAFEPDEVVLGGGNIKHLDEMPPRCRAGDNANAFLGGFRLWEGAAKDRASASAKALAAGRKKPATRKAAPVSAKTKPAALTARPPPKGKPAATPKGSAATAKPAARAKPPTAKK